MDQGDRSRAGPPAGCRITGELRLSLGVRDLDKSVDWYQRVLGLELLGCASWGKGRGAALTDPHSGWLVGFYEHEDNPGEPFDDLHTGMDHLEICVPTHGALEAWLAHLNSMDVEHSGVKPTANGARVLTFRDPDNIQLEFYLYPENVAKGTDERSES